MTESCLSAYPDKNIMPDDGAVSAVLGGAASMWDELRSHVEENYPCITGEWKHYGKVAGWTYKLISNKRNLLFFTPRNGSFRIRIVLGEKASTQAQIAPLPDEIKAAISSAKAYAEGRSIDIDVDRREQLEDIKLLLKLKHEN